jgi:outer membrane protein assembly factor BamB
MKWLRTLALLLLAALPALAADWPQWLGPHRDGVSSETIKPWKGELKVLWRQAVGPGHSSPVVAHGKVFLFAQVKGENKEEMLAFDAKTGTKEWNTSYERGTFFSPFGTGPQGTPAVAGGKVYSYGATGILSCFDGQSGHIDWKVDTKKEFVPPGLFFGVACSPLINGKNVIVDVGAKGASIVAFTKDKGEVAWKALDDKASYSSGINLHTAAGNQVVFLTQQALRGLSAKDGKPLWDFPLVDRLNESSTTPVVAGDILLAASVTYGMVGLKLKTESGKATVEQVWKNPKLTCYFSTPIPVGKEYVYVVTGVAKLLGASSSLHCVELATGKIVWSKEKIGIYHAAMLRTADNKILLLSDLGDLILFEPNPKEYKELARSKVVKGERIWAHPALANGKVYFRDDKELICLQMPE